MCGQQIIYIGASNGTIQIGVIFRLMRRQLPFLTAILLLLFTGSPRFSVAQITLGYEIISTAQGLSQGLINDMIQDREGFIWIATKGGLNRYDGYSFKVFMSDPADTNTISSNALSSLLVDKYGRIWIGTADGGVNVYNKKTGLFLRIGQKKGSASGLSSNRIESDMAELPDGRILVNPQGGNMNIISFAVDGKPGISSLNLPGGRMAKWIFKDSNDNIWITCDDDSSIFVFNASTNDFDLLYDGKRFTSLVEKTGKFLSSKFSQALGTAPIPSLRTGLIDSAGQLITGKMEYGQKGELIIDHRFVLTAGKFGVNGYDFSSIRAGDHLEDVYARNLKIELNDHNIKCLLLDRSGVLWVGMMGHGIYKYRVRSRRFLTLMPNTSIQKITTWNHDLVYAQGWRTAKLLTGTGQELPNPVVPVINDGLPYTNVLHTKKGDYWLYWNKRRKLLRYSPGMKLVSTYDELVNPLDTEQLQPLIEDSRQRIWICGSNGTLANIDPVSGQVSKFDINISSYTGTTAITQTNAFYEDPQGIFWLGTEHGFARLEFNDNSTAPVVTWYKNIPDNKHSLSYNYVSWFIQDPVDPKYLWIATKGGGINRLDKSTGNFIRYSTKQGLPNDVVYGLLADKAGNLWGSTNRGLFCMLSSKNNGQRVFRLFSISDGLQDDEFNTNGLASLSDGNLIFAGVKGINIFDPRKVLSGNFSPPVYITGIQIGNKIITPGDKTRLLHATIEKTATITLTHLQDVLTLEFSSLDYTDPLQNKYRYQLVGIDNDWVESGTRRSATYLHLPAGNYAFKVQGSNSQGIWSEHIAELEIKVLPPWWRSWWAYIVYAILAILAVRTWIQFNINRAKLRAQLSFEQLEAKRVKELDSIKTQLYTNITHEFRTPLTVILGMAQQVKEKPEVQFENRMDMIVRNGNNLLNLVNEMLDLSKLETGKMQLQVTKSEVIGFLRYVVESFQSLANSQGKQLHFLAEIDTLYLEYDREKLRQIVSNLLSNAIKFTPEKGNIYITVSDSLSDQGRDTARLVIKVKDTGIGITEDELPHIFDRFYQSDNSHTRRAEGTGIGLALTRELVKLMNGEIAVKSPPTGAVKGSQFTVQLPLKKAAVATNNIRNGIAAENTAEISTPSVVLAPYASETGKTNVPLILLVEDNADVVAYTASCLTDYRLAVGKDGREGFEIATEKIPDLVITDIMMPFVDGFELTAQLRSNELTSHIPVIMLTAKADMQSKIEGFQKGAEVYLEKPFNKDELLVRIQKLLEMRKYLQQYYLKAAGIENGIAPAGTEDIAITGQAINDEIKEDVFVRKVREAVEQHLTDIQFSVDKLCRLVFMSHSQLHRKLEALTGCSPNKFIRMIRLNKAKELLQDPANSIGSIALDCGYADPGYFARVFKQEFGLTPQEWRGKLLSPR